MERQQLCGVLWIGFALVAGTGCGNNRATPQTDINSTANSSEFRIQDSRNAAQNGSLRCLNPDECLDSLALVSIVSSEGLERCTGFLISENEIVTNDHCVSKSVSLKGWESRKSNLPCRDFIYVHFSGSNGEAGVTAGCESIRYRSGQTGVNSVDYAIIKLDQRIPGRNSLKWSARDFSDQESASIFRVQMTDEGSPVHFSGIQSRLNCKSSFHNFLFPELGSSESPLMTFVDCPIAHGNSGSPIFNQAGEIAGIVQAYLTVDERRDIREDLQRNLLDSYFESPAVATQAICMAEANPVRKRQCESPIPIPSISPSEYLRNASHKAKDFLPQSMPGLEWTEIKSHAPGEDTYLQVPVCTDGFNFESQVLKLRKGINHQLQLEWRALNDPTQTRVQFTRNGNGFFNPEYGNIKIPSCNLR